MIRVISALKSFQKWQAYFGGPEFGKKMSMPINLVVEETTISTPHHVPFGRCAPEDLVMRYR
jgi:hypothetical protein